jgi:hypothetical protein
MGKLSKRSPVVSPQVEAILKSRAFLPLCDGAGYHSPSLFAFLFQHVRERLHEMCGGADGVPNELLYRFPFPTGRGNRPRIFTLGSRGRAYLANELGLAANWYFRPHKMQHMGYGQLPHNILLTRFVVAAHTWCRNRAGYEVSQVRICYELAEKPSTLTITHEGERRHFKVIPDAWLECRRVPDGKRFPILLEIDRGMHFQKAFKDQVRSRVAYLDYGMYEETFGTKGALIVYANAGPTEEIAAVRRETLRIWTNGGLERLSHSGLGIDFPLSCPLA